MSYLGRVYLREGYIGSRRSDKIFESKNPLLPFSLTSYDNGTLVALQFGRHNIDDRSQLRYTDAALDTSILKLSMDLSWNRFQITQLR